MMDTVPTIVEPLQQYAVDGQHFARQEFHQVVLPYQQDIMMNIPIVDQSIATNPQQVVCIQQIDPGYSPPNTPSISRILGTYRMEKDGKGRIVIKQPREEHGFMIVVGVIALFILPCVGILILVAVYKSLKFEFILNNATQELIIRTVGIYTKKKSSISLPYSKIESFKIIMDQGLKPDGLPNGQLHFTTKDKESMHVTKGAVNYYSVVNMAQKATDLINERLVSNKN